jgi:hypothetical protein
MSQERTARLKNSLLASAAGLSGLFVTCSAHAYPYAYSSNQITSLTVTTDTGATPGRITPTAFSETISDTSAFGLSASETFSNGSTTPGTALTITQAFSGPSAPPSANFTANGPGSFVGTRANSAISAGDATNGGVAVDNVSEGSGDNVSFGTSNANNKATIGFVVVGTGEKVVLSFLDLFDVAVSTNTFGESANASIENTFSVIDALGNVIADFAPSALNETIGSTNGTSSTDTGELSQPFTFTTPDLTLGESYTLALTSGSSENIFPGGTSIPEPGSLALVGSALVGLGIVGRRSARTSRFLA